VALIYIDNPEMCSNSFYPLELQDIENAEDRLGYKFPSQLRDFYLEIGYGFFDHTADKKIRQEVYANRLMDPCSVADIKLLGYDSGQIISEVEFESNDLPIFEIADGANFLLMRPQSNNPNAVYGMLGELIESEFEKFIWRLYYENPTFYMESWGPLIDPIDDRVKSER
jgi:hypothetical protein